MARANCCGGRFGVANVAASVTASAARAAALSAAIRSPSLQRVSSATLRSLGRRSSKGGSPDRAMMPYFARVTRRVYRVVSASGGVFSFAVPRATKLNTGADGGT